MTGQVSAPRTMRVERNGYTLHAEVMAPDQEAAPWIVFSNSLVTDMSIWDPQVAALAGQFGILRYDQAGHGKSTLPQAAIGFDDLGADVLAVMDAASVEKAVFVGLSMGVPTGLSAHRLAPDRFIALAFSDGQARTAPGGAAGWAERIESARSSGMRSFAATTVERWLTGKNGSESRERLVEMIAATPFEGFRACATALMDYDYTDELSRIACPTLLVAGAEDGAMPEGMATKLKPAIAGSEMHVIENAGHVPCFEQPQAFNDILSGFLETTCGKSTQ